MKITLDHIDNWGGYWGEDFIEYVVEDGNANISPMFLVNWINTFEDSIKQKALNITLTQTFKKQLNSVLFNINMENRNELVRIQHIQSGFRRFYKDTDECGVSIIQQIICNIANSNEFHYKKILINLITIHTEDEANLDLQKEYEPVIKSSIDRVNKMLLLDNPYIYTTMEEFNKFMTPQEEHEFMRVYDVVLKNELKKYKIKFFA